LTTLGNMTEKLHIDIAALMREIARYLAAVDAFRAAGHEPSWLPEPGVPTPAGTPARRALDGARPARA
jgi:hypothetical protein